MLFKHESDKIILGIQNEIIQFESEINKWKITEKFNPDEFDKNRNLGYYNLIITSDVSTKDELNEIRMDVRSLLNQLDKLLIYVTGTPITFKPHQYKLSNKKEIIFYEEDPTGWTTNYNDLLKEFSKDQVGIKATIKGGMHHWSIIDELPLKKLLIVREKFLKTNNIIKTLVNLHYTGIKSYGELKFLAYGKALEIVRSILPGKTDSEKEKNLHKDSREIFDGTKLKWLYNVSNNRYETRHIIKNPENQLLHSEMDGEEFQEFSGLADNLFRVVVLDKLGLDIIMFNDE